MRLSEAFKALDALNEDTFTLSNDGIKKLAEFENNDDLVDELSVIDLDAETEEDFKDSYVGKVILDCCVCHSKLYKDKADVTIDEESQLANVGEDCPYCYTPDGFKIVGEVSPFVKKEDDEEEVTNTDTEEVKDDTTNDTVDDDVKDTDDNIEESVIEDNEDKEDLQEGIFGKKNDKKTPQPNTSVKKQEWELFDIITHQITGQKFDNKYDAEKEAATREKETGHIYKVQLVESTTKELSEDVNNVNVETDDQIVNIESDESGKVTVTTEPKTEETTTDDAEVVVPVSDETITEIENNDNEEVLEPEVSDEEVDIEIDEFDEESFDDLGEQYFRESYDNVETFKTSNIKETENGYIVEGVLKFTSGNNKKTSFLFESKVIDKNDTVKFLGENLDINTGKGAFTMTGKVTDKKLVVESLSYNYETEDGEGNKNKVSGIVKRG